MKLHHFDNAQQYYERVKNYLLQHEADHNLILAITDNIIRSPEHFTQQPYLVTVEDETILAVALHYGTTQAYFIKGCKEKGDRSYRATPLFTLTTFTLIQFSHCHKDYTNW